MPRIEPKATVYAGSVPTLTAVLGQGADANASAITNLADPSLAQDAATKAYVDTADAVAVDTDGFLHLSKNAAPTDGSLSAGELKFWFDKSNGAAKVMFKGKTTDGTVVTGSVSLT